MTNNSVPYPAVRVLIVDDNVDAADALSLILSIQGAMTAVAHDGVQGLAAASELRPHLVLLDLGLPGMNGYDVAVQMRLIPGLEEIVIVALSGWGDDVSRARSQASGFDQHLTKPANIEDLSQLVHAAARVREAL